MKKEEIVTALIMMKSAWMMVVDTPEDLEAAKVGIQALDAAISALRGPTREQVEKMKEEWFPYSPAAGEVLYRCSGCGLTADAKAPFCPQCGAPMTDEAVDMTMKRLGEMQNDQ